MPVSHVRGIKDVKFERPKWRHMKFTSLYPNSTKSTLDRLTKLVNAKLAIKNKMDQSEGYSKYFSYPLINTNIASSNNLR